MGAILDRGRWGKQPISTTSTSRIWLILVSPGSIGPSQPKSNGMLQGLPSCSMLTWHFTLIFRLMLRVKAHATSQLVRQLLLHQLLRHLLQATRCGYLPLLRCTQKCWPMDLQSSLIQKMLESPTFLYAYILYPICLYAYILYIS